jgi:flagellar hook-length control protein FliK
MTMQTTSLPIQFNAAPVPGQRANANPATDGVSFGAALTQQLNLQQLNQRQTEQRQLEQRQALAQPQTQATMPQPAVAGPKPQAPAKPAANEAKPAPRETVKQAAKETEHPAVSKKGDSASAPEEKTAAAEGERADDEAATSAEAKVADAVVDMLALVASFNQVQQPAAAVVPVAAQAPAAQPDALLSSVKATPGDGAEPLVKQGGDATLASLTDAPQDKAQPGIDLRALDPGKAAETAKLPAEGADFAARLRDSAPHGGMKEAAPGAEALTSLSAQATALQTAQATTTAPTDRLSARVGTPAWDNQVGQKVIWMVGGEDQSATLELNPPDLGPVQVVLNVSNDLASVTFSSQQLEVRQALENALPRLREMMSENGIALGNATVNAGAEGRQGQDGQGTGGSGRGRGGNGGGDSDVADVTPRPRTRVIGGAGAVDTFA